jgi:hypothetical protein
MNATVRECSVPAVERHPYSYSGKLPIEGAPGQSSGAGISTPKSLFVSAESRRPPGNYRVRVVVQIQMHMTFTSACLGDNVQGIVLSQW